MVINISMHEFKVKNYSATIFVGPLDNSVEGLKIAGKITSMAICTYLNNKKAQPWLNFGIYPA